MTDENISREAAIASIKHEDPSFAFAIERVPAADVAPVLHGKWEERCDENDDPLFRQKFICSVCGDWQTYGKTPYCPYCGAKMEGEK